MTNYEIRLNSSSPNYCALKHFISQNFNITVHPRIIMTLYNTALVICTI